MVSQLNIAMNTSTLILDYIKLISIWILVLLFFNIPGMPDDYSILWCFAGFPAIIFYGYLSAILIPKLRNVNKGFKTYYLWVMLISIPIGIAMAIAFTSIFGLWEVYSWPMIFSLAFTYTGPQLFIVAPLSWLIYITRLQKAEEMNAVKELPQNDLTISDHLFIKTGYEQVRVDLTDICYLEATGNYVNFVLKDSNVTTRMTITEAEAILPSEDFIRIHRSFIVAVDKITKIERHQVIVNGAVLPIGKSYYDNIDQIKNT
jgi:hypothetical protein